MDPFTISSTITSPPSSLVSPSSCGPAPDGTCWNVLEREIHTLLIIVSHCGYSNMLFFNSFVV